LAVKSYVERKKIMTNTGISQQEAVNEIYSYAANLLFIEKKNSTEVKNSLVEKGFSEDGAFTIVKNLKDEAIKAKREGANKDMLYGALWCAGGTVATVANIGFIFWGAILFGGIQFFKGLINYFNAD
jgi:hypothetical protein